jgi:hypothetical protein
MLGYELEDIKQEILFETIKDVRRTKYCCMTCTLTCSFGAPESSSIPPLVLTSLYASEINSSTIGARPAALQ